MQRPWGNGFSPKNHKKWNFLLANCVRNEYYIPRYSSHWCNHCRGHHLSVVVSRDCGHLIKNKNQLMYRIVKKIYQKDLIFFDIYCCVNVHFFRIHVFNLFMFGKKLQLFKKCFVLSFVCELFQTMRNLERMMRQKFYNIFCTKFSLKSHLMKTRNTRRLKM